MKDDKVLNIILVIIFITLVVACIIWSALASEFESVSVGPRTGNYLVISKKINRNNKTIDCVTSDGVRVVVKCAGGTDTPIQLAPGTKTVITVCNRHLTSVVPIDQ